MSLNINDLITDNTNIIEIYICNALNNKDNLKINIKIEDDILNNIRKKFKLTKQTKMVYYTRNNLCYVYDLSNDSQYVYIRKLENKQIFNNIFVLAFNEMKMQSHSFPCTNDINEKYEYNVEEFKINNRISLIIKNNIIYISYKHSKEVEIDKIQEIINKIITKILISI